MCDCNQVKMLNLTSYLRGNVQTCNFPRWWSEVFKFLALPKWKCQNLSVQRKMSKLITVTTWKMYKLGNLQRVTWKFETLEIYSFNAAESANL